MRSLAFVGIAVALAGCSLPYEGTSFKAVPKPEHMAMGEERKTNDVVPSPLGSEPTTATGTEHETMPSPAKYSGAVQIYTGDVDGPVPGGVSGAGSGHASQTNTVFPDKFQPAG